MIDPDSGDQADDDKSAFMASDEGGENATPSALHENLGPADNEVSVQDLISTFQMAAQLESAESTCRRAATRLPCARLKQVMPRTGGSLNFTMSG